MIVEQLIKSNIKCEDFTPKRLDTRYIAKGYIESGLAIAPIKRDGSKSPKIKWREGYRGGWFNLQSWFGHFNPNGIGILCGAVSGNLEVLDFDLGANASMRIWSNYVLRMIPDLREKIVMVRTPSNGFHIFYRCSEIEGSQKLSMCFKPKGFNHKDDKLKVLIETKGEGGYVVAPGSPPDTHKSGKKYEVIHGDLHDIKTITPEERKIFIACAKAIGDVEAKENEQKDRPKPNKAFHSKFTFPENTDSDFNYDFIDEVRNSLGLIRPGDRCNEEMTWEDVLSDHGWSVETNRGDVIDWTRPHKNGGVSATTGHCGDHLYVFSTSAYPFEAGKSYDKFAAFTLLNFNGDFTASAKCLSKFFKENDNNE